MPRSQSLNAQILAIAWPAIVSNITTPLLGLVDTAIAGHLGNSVDLAAIAIGTTAFNLIYWLFGFLRMTTAGLTSQAFGANNISSENIVLWRSVAIALLVGVSIVALSPWIGPAVLRVLDTDDATRSEALVYFRIVVMGAPAVLISYSLNGWLIGMQNTRIPMFVAIATNVVNIALSTVFVFVLNLKINGIAFGTMLSQWVALGICALWLHRSYKPKLIALKRIFSSMRHFMSLNLDIFLRTLCMIFVTAWFTRAGASQGVSVLAANAVLMQFFLLFSYFSDGFAYAGEALAGKFYGMGNPAMLRRCVNSLLKWGAAIAVIFTAVYFFGGEALLAILTDRRDVVDTAREYLVWMLTIPICGIGAFIYDGVFIGLTRTRSMMTSVVLGMALFFAIYLLLQPLMGNHALWLAFAAWLSLRGAVLHFLFRHGKSRR